MLWKKKKRELTRTAVIIEEAQPQSWSIMENYERMKKEEDMEHEKSHENRTYLILNWIGSLFITFNIFIHRI